jgi:hypothetical protein
VDNTVRPSGALAEMLAQSGELDEILSGHGLTFERAPVTPAAHPPATFYVPPPNWEEEAAERAQLERERQEEERRKIVEEELARIAAEDEQTYPAPPAKNRRWRP